ncbi:MAG: aldo/keto reductase, partial [Limisphaerales bacterium]
MTTNSSAQHPGEAPDRRRFLKHLGVVGAGLAVTDALPVRAATQHNTVPTPAGPVPRRDFGRTGVQVSILGVGGHAIGQCKTEAEGVRIIHEALEAGVNFMDNAWEYHDGRSERWMGAALNGRRDEAFLMTKVCTPGRDAKMA